MKTNNDLNLYLRSFFLDYLGAQRGVSRHTLLSYRDVIKLFLQFAARKRGKDVTRLTIEMLDASMVLAFLEHLEHERGVCVKTRNQRLAALHTFYRHVSGVDPLHFDLCHRVIAIPLKRATVKRVSYLELPELNSIIAQIDRSKRSGRRNHALIFILYNTGCRVQEILNLRACDFQSEPFPQLRILGKGKKERFCPLWDETADVIKDLLKERGINPWGEEIMFTNVRGGNLTRFGAQYMLKKYRRQACDDMPSLKNKNITPHTLRHTTATHILQAGGEMSSIKNILGHASTTTTEHYAEINLEMKRKVIASISPHSEMGTTLPSWRRDKNLIDWLEAL